jgi:hypothetical protein
MPLKLLRETAKRKGGQFALYLCDCGREAEKRMANVKAGVTKSCGSCPRVRKAMQRNKANLTNKLQPWQQVASKIEKQPLPVPSFDDVSKRTFKRVAQFPFWLIVSGERVIDKQPMTLTERIQYVGGEK